MHVAKVSYPLPGNFLYATKSVHFCLGVEGEEEYFEEDVEDWDVGEQQDSMSAPPLGEVVAAAGLAFNKDNIEAILDKLSAAFSANPNKTVGEIIIDELEANARHNSPQTALDNALDRWRRNLGDDSNLLSSKELKKLFRDLGVAYVLVVACEEDHIVCAAHMRGQRKLARNLSIGIFLFNQELLSLLYFFLFDIACPHLDPKTRGPCGKPMNRETRIDRIRNWLVRHMMDPDFAKSTRWSDDFEEPVEGMLTSIFGRQFNVSITPNASIS